MAHDLSLVAPALSSNYQIFFGGKGEKEGVFAKIHSVPSVTLFNFGDQTQQFAIERYVIAGNLF